MALNSRVLSDRFERRFERPAEIMVLAPGRVNLIGEHTDYNDGFVLPAAIDRHIAVLASPRDDSLVQAYSLDFDALSKFRTARIGRDHDRPWSHYVRGVIQQVERRFGRVRGMDLMITGNLPIGGGLSSSAALETAVAESCRVLGGLDLEPLEMARLCQRAEEEFVGVQCGIMDQFISALARRDSALFLDCRDLSYRPLAMNPEIAVVVCDSRVQRSLDDSEYNLRKSECEQAVSRLREYRPALASLRDVTVADLQAHGARLPDNLLRRARHVVTENVRVVEAVGALERGDLDAFGELLVASHDSLRDDYQVSCRELDLLVEAALSHPGTLGARLTGAGFGGCTVNLVRRHHAESFRERVRQRYLDGTGLEAGIRICRLSGGVRSVKLD